MDGFTIAQQWEVHVAVALLAAFPLFRICRRAGVSPWPLVFLAVPVFGFAVVGSYLAFTRWPKVAPRVKPKR